MFREAVHHKLPDLLHWCVHWAHFADTEQFLADVERAVLNTVEVQRLRQLEPQFSLQVLAYCPDLASYCAGWMTRVLHGVHCTVTEENQWTMQIENLGEHVREAVRERLPLVATLALQDFSLFGTELVPLEEFTGVLDLTSSQLTAEQAQQLPTLLPNCTGLRIHANRPFLEGLLHAAENWQQIVHLHCEKANEDTLIRVHAGFKHRVSQFQSLSLPELQTSSKVLTDQLRVMSRLKEIAVSDLKPVSQVLFKRLLLNGQNFEVLDLSDCTVQKVYSGRINHLRKWMETRPSLRTLKLGHVRGAFTDVVADESHRTFDPQRCGLCITCVAY